MMIFLMVASTTIASYAPPVEGAQIVITEAVQVVDGGQVNDRMAAVGSDDDGNIHVVWSRNTQHLYYSMLDARASTLIDATQISNPGSHRAWHPDMAVDSEGKVHIVWTDTSSQHAIMYTLLDPIYDDLAACPGDDSMI